MFGPLDHIGIAVRDLEDSIKHYESVLGYKVLLREHITSQSVDVAFLSVAGAAVDTEECCIELLAPASDSSTLSRFLEKRGQGLHHVCYRTEDIIKELERLRHCGCTLIDEKPRDGARDTLIAFIHPKNMGGVLVELCQSK